jgi:exonuclease SbcC
MGMKRKILDVGGYSREYLITQTPELLSMCDAVIDVAEL